MYDYHLIIIDIIYLTVKKEFYCLLMLQNLEF